MLVLSRKTDEQIVIGDDIRITVLRVKGDRVKLGIQAGDQMRIMRAELLDLPADSLAEPATEPQHRVADPAAGLPHEPPCDDGSLHSAGGADALLDSRQSLAHPAWLTICCCS